MDKITFSTNWNNKLGCNVFTTIRLANKNKYFKGNVLELWLKQQRLQNVEVIEYVECYANELKEYLCYTDTGYSKNETLNILKAMYKLDTVDSLRICVVLLRKIKVNSTEQASLI